MYATNGMPDIGADAMYANATEKGTIDTLPEIPGLAIWREGHIGVYVGDGQVIHASSTTVGVIQTSVAAGTWTHWLKIPYINYIGADDPVEPDDTPQETVLPINLFYRSNYTGGSPWRETS